MFNTGIEGVSSTGLPRELGISEKTASHLAHRSRKRTWEGDCARPRVVPTEMHDGPSEIAGPVSTLLVC